MPVSPAHQHWWPLVHVPRLAPSSTRAESWAPPAEVNPRTAPLQSGLSPCCPPQSVVPSRRCFGKDSAEIVLVKGTGKCCFTSRAQLGAGPGVCHPLPVTHFTSHPQTFWAPGRVLLYAGCGGKMSDMTCPVVQKLPSRSRKQTSRPLHGRGAGIAPRTAGAQGVSVNWTWACQGRNR